MIRLLGFIVGSAASIVAILLLLGIPQLNLSNPHLDKARFDEALNKLRDKQHEIESAAALAADISAEAQTTGQSTPDADAPAAPVAGEAAATPPATAAASMQSALQDGDPPLTPVDGRQWYTFWNPFRSEIAARGFVSQLERVTGLDYRVVKVKSGVYEVAFAYEGDVERQAKLSQIQAATGLDLPGS